MMEKEKILQSADEFVKKLFDKESSGHDYYHTKRVVDTAVCLAKDEGVDVFITSLAAYLHDADDYKIFGTAEGKPRAESFMKEAGIDGKTLTRVIEIIDEVSFRGKDSKTPSSPEGRCVQDADRLDAMGAIGIARAFAYGGKNGRMIYDPGEAYDPHMSGEEYMKKRSSSVGHFYEKLLLLRDMMNTNKGREMAAERDRFMREYLKELQKETGVNFEKDIDS